MDVKEIREALEECLGYIQATDAVNPLEALARGEGYSNDVQPLVDKICKCISSLSTIDPDAIRRECLESIRSHLRSMTQADIIKWDGPGVLGGAMSKELFNKTLEYAILGAEQNEEV